MVDQTSVDAVLLSKNRVTSGQNPLRLALFNSDGTPKVLPNTPAAAQANSTADTIEELVADFNSLLAKLRAAGILTP